MFANHHATITYLEIQKLGVDIRIETLEVGVWGNQAVL